VRCKSFGTAAAPARKHGDRAAKPAVSYRNAPPTAGDATLRCLSDASWPEKTHLETEAAARQVCEIQRDPGLVVYACPAAGGGWHLGHRHTTPATSSPLLVNAQVAPMLPNPQHKEFPMKMQATLGHPILITLYSAALLLFGCAVGVRFSHALPTALWLCAAGSVLVAVHDLATGFVWFWLAATWVRSVKMKRDTRG
jgi:hypothetical protein